MQELINRAKELLADGTVARVLGWKAGDLPYNPEPAYFETEESLKDFVYNGFCGANLSKYMIEASKLEGKTLVCLKPCDTYSFNQLIKEHRVDRENGFRCRVVEISVRDNELFSFTRQKKIDHATNITGEIAAYAYQIFKENYNWSKPIRSVGVRGADLVTDNYWEQIDLFSSVEKREKQMKMDSAVDEIRRRFGFYSIQRGLMYRDRILSAVNAKEEHTVQLLRTH